MIGVRMRIDDGFDRTQAAMPEIEVEASARRLRAGQRVDDDDPGPPFDDRHVGKIEPADLVDAIDDLEQPMAAVELGEPPQARIDRVGRRTSPMKAYWNWLQTGLPEAPRISALVIVPIKPRSASAKSSRFSNGSSFKTAALRAATRGSAACGLRSFGGVQHRHVPWLRACLADALGFALKVAIESLAL
jgi:hypothetical protein